MFTFGAIVGFLLGGVLVGEVAHRKPEWFNKGVKVINDVIDKTK